MIWEGDESKHDFQCMKLPLSLLIGLMHFDFSILIATNGEVGYVCRESEIFFGGEESIYFLSLVPKSIRHELCS